MEGINRRKFLGMLAGGAAATMSYPAFSKILEGADLEELINLTRPYYENRGNNPFWMPKELFLGFQDLKDKGKSLGEDGSLYYNRVRFPYSYDLFIRPAINGDFSTGHFERKPELLAERMPEQYRSPFLNEGVLPPFEEIDQKLYDVLQSISAHSGLPQDDLNLKALIESSFNLDVGKSSRGARGPLQIMPEVYAEIRQRGDFKGLYQKVREDTSSINSEVVSLAVAGALAHNDNTRFLGLQAINGRDTLDSIAESMAYNAGIGATINNYEKSKDFAQTVAYVGKVLAAKFPNDEIIQYVREIHAMNGTRSRISYPELV